MCHNLSYFNKVKGNKINLINIEQATCIYFFPLNVALSEYLSQISTNVQILGSPIKQDIGMQFQRGNNQICQDQTNFQELQFQSYIIHSSQQKNIS